MTYKQHAAALMAYAYRLRPEHIKAILAARGQAIYAGMNLGTDAQAEAFKNMETVCKSAVEGINNHDLKVVEHIIKEYCCGKNQSRTAKEADC